MKLHAQFHPGTSAPDNLRRSEQQARDAARKLSEGDPAGEYHVIESRGVFSVESDAPFIRLWERDVAIYRKGKEIKP